jgi:hypothetical protein
MELKPVTDLATEYKNHLLIASKSPHICLSSAQIVRSSKSRGKKDTSSVHTSHPGSPPFTDYPRTRRLEKISEWIRLMAAEAR